MHPINIFNNQFSCSRTSKKLTSDINRICQDIEESLRDYVRRFKREVLDIPNLDVAIVVEAIKMGLKKDSPFHADLVMTPCKKLDEV